MFKRFVGESDLSAEHCYTEAGRMGVFRAACIAVAAESKGHSAAIGGKLLCWTGVQAHDTQIFKRTTCVNKKSDFFLEVRKEGVRENEICSEIQ